MRDVQNKRPCNPADPMHSKSCCDRKPRFNQKTFTEDEKATNGPCRFWNEGQCSFPNCKFLHAEICHFQSRCRYGSSQYKFFHFESLQQEEVFFLKEEVKDNTSNRRTEPKEDDKTWQKKVK